MTRAISRWAQGAHPTPRVVARDCWNTNTPRGAAGGTRQRRFLSRRSGLAWAGAALLCRARFQELADALDEERNAFAHLVQPEDGREGILAFVEKHEPAWRVA
jgi:enoyl-CoA hydratase/carnithine racemase